MGIKETLALKFGVPLILAKERLRGGIAFNPLSPDWKFDPHPRFRELRAKSPVHHSDLLDGWVLTRYADVVSVLKDPRFSADRARIENDRLADQIDFENPTFQMLSRTMLLVDPPDHTRLRTLVSKAFTPRRIEEMRPRIQAVVDSLLDDVAASGRMDVIRDLAVPLPVIVIAEMLGVDPADRGKFKVWSDDLVSTLADFGSDPAAQERANAAVLELADYFRAVIAARRLEPRDDLISAMIAAEEQGDVLSENEMLGTCVLLLVAGNETTTNLIGNGLLSLLQHPAELERLKSQPGLIESATEEMLRYEFPVQSTVRIPIEDVEVGGKKLRKGQIVMVAVGAANRDPEQFPEPDRFDIMRSPNRHVAFGQGIHFCIGAQLARAEGQTAFSTVLQRFPELRMIHPKPEWNGSMILRGLSSLEVELAPAATRDPERAPVAAAGG
ncbi:MAG: cytochrome P450 [Dehalococcoidia bacterium]